MEKERGHLAGVRRPRWSATLVNVPSECRRFLDVASDQQSLSAALKKHSYPWPVGSIRGSRARLNRAPSSAADLALSFAFAWTSRAQTAIKQCAESSAKRSVIEQLIFNRCPTDG
jgi:hypothetical protein